MKKRNLLFMFALSLIFIFVTTGYSEPREKKPMRAREEIQQRFKEMQNDPKTKELQDKIKATIDELRDLRAKYEATSADADKSAIKDQIKDKVSKSYDLQIELFEYKLTQMQNKIQDMKTNRDKNIADRADRWCQPRQQYQSKQKMSGKPRPKEWKKGQRPQRQPAPATAEPDGSEE